MLSYLLGLLIQILSFIILLYVILSFFMRPDHDVMRFLSKIVDPILNPIRRVVPSLMGLDFSPVILMLIVSALGNALIRILYRLGL